MVSYTVNVQFQGQRVKGNGRFAYAINPLTPNEPYRGRTASPNL